MCHLLRRGCGQGSSSVPAGIQSSLNHCKKGGQSTALALVGVTDDRGQILQLFKLIWGPRPDLDKFSLNSTQVLVLSASDDWSKTFNNI